MKQLSSRAQEIFDEAMTAAGGDRDQARLALEDGEYLTTAGYTDADQAAIEEAHAELSN